MEITAQTYQLISLIGFILAAVFCVTAIVIWFKFGIWKVFGELSGRTQKKRIEQMRKDNKTSGKKQFRPMPAAMGGGKISPPIEEDSGLQKNDRAGTVPLAAGLTETETAPLAAGSTETETIPLAAGSTETETIPLAVGSIETETIPLTVGPTETETETALLSGALPEPTENQTSLLNSGTEHPDETESEAVVFHMIQDIVIIHTSEAI